MNKNNLRFALVQLLIGWQSDTRPFLLFDSQTDSTLRGKIFIVTRKSKVLTLDFQRLFLSPKTVWSVFFPEDQRVVQIKKIPTS